MLSARHFKIASETLQVVSGQLVALAGSLSLLSSISLNLTSTAYGALSLGLTGSLLVSQLITSGTIAAISRHYSNARDVGQLKAFLRASLHLFWNDQLLIASFTMISASALALTIGDPWSTIAMGAGCFSIFNSWLVALLALLNGGRHRFVASALTALDPWMKMLLLVLCWRVMPASPAQILVFFGIVNALLSLLAMLGLRSLLGQLFSADHQPKRYEIYIWISQMRVYGRPFSRYGLVTWFQQASDRWALQAWAGPASVAQYSIVYQLGYSSLGVLSNMLGTLLSPILYDHAGDSRTESRNHFVHQIVQKLVFYGLLLSLFAFIVALILNHWLFSFLVAPVYKKSAIFLPWMVLASSLFAIGQLIALKFTSVSRTAELGRIKIFTAFLGIFLNCFGAYLGGVSGVVVAQILFALSYLLWMMNQGLRAPAKVII